MARPRKAASMQTGHTHSKEKLKEIAEYEARLTGDIDKIKIVPDYLDTLGQAYYDYIVKELDVSKLLCNLDIPLVEQTADCLSKIRKADEIINREGIIITQMDRNGNEIIKEHPAIGTKMKYLDRFTKLSGQLSMSPTSRATIASMQIQAKEEEEDPVLKLLSQ